MCIVYLNKVVERDCVQIGLVAKMFLSYAGVPRCNIHLKSHSSFLLMHMVVSRGGDSKTGFLQLIR